MRSAPIDHYAVLGLEAGASPDDIRQAYRHLAKLCHPDVQSGQRTDTERMAAINAAYEVLGDVQRRAEYDQQLAGVKAVPSPRPSARSARSVNQDVFLRLNDFLRGTRLELQVKDADLVGTPETYELHVPAMTPPGTRFRISRTASPAGGVVAVRVRLRPEPRLKARGSDLQTDARITAQLAVQGGVTFVLGPDGSRVRLVIPARIASGTLIRIDGQGLPTARGGRGDLLVRVLHRPQVLVRRRRG